MDWNRAGILNQLYQGLGSGRGDERFGKWRLYSIFDIWTLGFYKRLRDEGIYIERLRDFKKKADAKKAFEGEAVQWWFYQALPSWIHRHPYWVHTDMRGLLSSTPIERKNPAIYIIRIGHIEPETTDMFFTLNLLPIMDKALSLSGPLELSTDKAKGLVVRLEGEELPLEPLPKEE